MFTPGIKFKKKSMVVTLNRVSMVLRVGHNKDIVAAVGPFITGDGYLPLSEICARAVISIVSIILIGPIYRKLALVVT